MSLKVTYEGNPGDLSINKAYARGKASFYVNDSYAAAKAKLGCAAMHAMRHRDPIDGPVAVSIVSYWAKESDGYAKGDVDGPCKGVLDALQGEFYVDDRQVVKLSVSKRRSKKARIEIRARPTRQLPVELIVRVFVFVGIFFGAWLF